MVVGLQHCSLQNMTVDDDKSIYVGGLPNAATEDTLRRVFSLYGSIVAVKLISDHGPRGKCYGFVTFRNPRSVTDAINDMNGKTIDGRVVRVNGVTTRGGRSNFSREHFQRNQERVMDRGRDSNQGGDHDRNKDRYTQRYSDRSREHEQSWGNDEERERGYEHDQARDNFINADQNRKDDRPDDEEEHGGNSDWHMKRGNIMDWDSNMVIDVTKDIHKFTDRETDYNLKTQNGMAYNGLDSSDQYRDEVKERLERLRQKRDELKYEISQVEEQLISKQHHISGLQKKTKKLEDALITEKKIYLQRRMQLTKLHKCFLKVKEYTSRLKNSEQELQSLVDSAVMECSMGDDVGTRVGIVSNANP
ncbi:hypothetical protein K2173_007640 [Erythroxylum novogranatense]|uniref:RRM domain-containing protein n=1 Tax=Erythroxylum novogranatense TaxID=1862640 RepID=A0AAV8TS38_9ROSI|nr:hypothetical protein K2173_007640 [Erythroxylum novogranatense]